MGEWMIDWGWMFVKCTCLLSVPVLWFGHTWFSYRSYMLMTSQDLNCLNQMQDNSRNIYDTSASKCTCVVSRVVSSEQGHVLEWEAAVHVLDSLRVKALVSQPRHSPQVDETLTLVANLLTLLHWDMTVPVVTQLNLYDCIYSHITRNNMTEWLLCWFQQWIYNEDCCSKARYRVYWLRETWKYY